MVIYLFKDKRGFTLVEMMIVIVIIGILTAVVLPRGTRQAQDSYALEGESRNLAQNLRLARETAMAEGRSVRLHMTIESATYVIERVTSSSTETVRTINMENGVIINSVTLGVVTTTTGDAAVLFQSSGKTDQNGNIVVQARDGRRRNVSVNTLGVIEVGNVY